MKRYHTNLIRFFITCAFASTLLASHGATFNVTSTADDGAGSLRQAILDANATTNDAAPDLIDFSIAEPGVQTISPTTELPAIIDPVILDGYTQTNASPNTVTNGNNAVLLIELDGAALGIGTNGLTIATSNSTVRGLVINRFGGSGIAINGDHNIVAGNFIGTDATGTTNRANAANGVQIVTGNNNTIGGTELADGNLIAFNGDAGVAVDGASSGNAIVANRIFEQGGLGIDLGSNGVTDNDAGDADTGPNNLQNFPVINLVVADNNTGPTNITISGTVTGATNTELALEFFQNVQCDPSEFGEGQQSLGFTSATTDTNGVAAFEVEFQAVRLIGPFLTATATDPDGNTSEFSACVPPSAPPTNQAPNAICQDVTTNATANCEATVAASAVDNGSFDPDADPITLSLDPSGPYPIGSNVVMLVVVDDQDETNTCAATIHVVDTTVPSIVCPANILVHVGNNSSAIVNFPEPAASDNCSVASTHYVPASGSSFGLGTNAVTRTAIDASGNTNTCQFLVIVRSGQNVPHDLAVTNLKVPKKLSVKSPIEPQRIKVRVTLRNLAPRFETIRNKAMMADLVTLLVQSLGECAAPVVESVISDDLDFPIDLAPLEDVKVEFRVTIGCANDPAPNSKRETGHEDYRFIATINHAVLDGESDTTPSNDVCPRAPSESDKGCGNKNPSTKLLGDPVTTDVVVK